MTLTLRCTGCSQRRDRTVERDHRQRQRHRRGWRCCAPERRSGCERAARGGRTRAAASRNDGGRRILNRACCGMRRTTTRHACRTSHVGRRFATNCHLRFAPSAFSSAFLVHAQRPKPARAEGARRRARTAARRRAARWLGAAQRPAAHRLSRSRMMALSATRQGRRTTTKSPIACGTARRLQLCWHSADATRSVRTQPTCVVLVLTPSAVLIVNKMAIRLLPVPSLVLVSQLVVSARFCQGGGAVGVLDNDAFESGKIRAFFPAVCGFLAALFCNAKARWQQRLALRGLPGFARAHSPHSRRRCWSTPTWRPS